MLSNARNALLRVTFEVIIGQEATCNALHRRLRLPCTHTYNL